MEAAFESDAVGGALYRPDNPSGDALTAPTGHLPMEGAGHDLKRGLDLSAILERFRALLWYPGN
jgi:hypothetical protein